MSEYEIAVRNSVLNEREQLKYLFNKFADEYWLKIDKNNMACESNSYTHEQLLEMQKYAIVKMNNYLDKNYNKDDKILKKTRNKVIKKSTN